MKRADYKTFAGRWLFLACICLLVSGLLSLSLAFSRMPWWMSLFKDPLLIRRILVVHVDLGVSVWLTAFPVAIWLYLNSEQMLSPMRRLFLLFSQGISILGLVIMSLGGIFSGGLPILANYIPIVDNSFFILGLGLYGAGVILTIIGPELKTAWNTRLQFPLRFGALIGILFFIEAFLAILYSATRIGDGVTPLVRYELMMWAGGHLLQFANATFMLVAWGLVLNSLGVLIQKPKDLIVSFSWLGFLLLIAPVIFIHDITTSEFRESFTYLMRWGIFPPVIFFILKSVPELMSSLKQNKISFTSDIRIFGFFISIFLILTGFIFGLLIRGSDLRVPGHYHVSIGAVSLAYTLGAIWFFSQLEWTKSSKIFEVRLSKNHIWFYGLGQWLHGFGMVIAGYQGVTRKVYGVEQIIPNFTAKVGMGIMGVGGGVAAIGGIFFLIIWLKYTNKKKL